MGIDDSMFLTVWRGIDWWRKQRGMTLKDLARRTHQPLEYIQRGIQYGNEWLTSDFVHDCVDAFRLHNARSRGIEDTVDVLTDEECITLLIEPLQDQRQGSFL